MIVILLIVLFIKDIEVDEEKTRAKAINNINGTQTSKDKINGYFSLLAGGIKVIFQSKTVFFFIIGLSIYRATWLIWGNLILFPLYFGYTGSDIGASTLRTTLFFVGIPVSFFMANVSKKIANERFQTIIFLQLLTFFPSFVILTYYVPVTNEFNLIGIIGTFFLLGTLVGILFNLGNTLSQRILLDLIPSENRNSVYSLMPSIVSILGIPLLPIAGAAVDTYGLYLGILIAGIVCAVGFVFFVTSSYFKNPKNKLENQLSDSSTTRTS
jgi:hypothetical protein